MTLKKDTLVCFTGILTLGLIFTGLMYFRISPAYQMIQKRAEVKENLETISGIPISSEGSTREFYGYSGTVIEDNEGKYVLARHTNNRIANPTNLQKIMDSSTIIQSEINDGDNEPIELQGNYDGNVFEFYKVKANGLEVDLLE
jgi:hypothetical protein